AQHEHEDGQQKRSDSPELQDQIGKIGSQDADPVAGSMRSSQDRGAVHRRIERRIGRQREEKEEGGDAQQESDEFVQTPVPGGLKNLCKRCHVAATAMLARSLPHSAVSWPELDNYDKNRKFLQCGKRDWVASWVRAGNSRGS